MPRKLADIFRPIAVPDYVQLRKVQRQKDGLPLYPGLEFSEAHEAFERDKEKHKQDCIEQVRDRRLQWLDEYYGSQQTEERARLAHALRKFDLHVHVLKGRPNAWNHITLYELWFEVRQLFKDGEFQTLQHACDYLAMQEKWTARIGVQSGRTIAINLFEHYAKAKKIQLVQFVEWLCNHPNLAGYDGDIATEFLVALLSDK